MRWTLRVFPSRALRRRRLSVVAERELDGVVEGERAPLVTDGVVLVPERRARRSEVALEQRVPERNRNRHAKRFPERFDRPREDECEAGIARPGFRHRHTLHLEARLDDVAERKGGAQTLPVAGSRLLGVTADERAVGEEVVSEVFR